MAENDEAWERPGAPARSDATRRQEPLTGGPQADDHRLVAALRKGDAVAFEALVRDHGPRLLAVARRILRSEEDARDCVQDTFLAAHRSIEEFEERAHLGAWLRRIAVNAALMKLRARRSRPEASIEDLLPHYDGLGFREGPRPIHSLGPDELLERDDTRKIVRAAMDRLPESYRTVLLLRDIEGYSTAEAAELLQSTPGAVKVRVHRGRTALKQLLSPLFEEDLR